MVLVIWNQYFSYMALLTEGGAGAESSASTNMPSFPGEGVLHIRKFVVRYSVLSTQHSALRTQHSFAQHSFAKHSFVQHSFAQHSFDQHSFPCSLTLDLRCD